MPLMPSLPPPSSPAASAHDTHVHTLPNGVRVLTLVLPHLHSASVSVFVRAGSRD